MDYTGVYEDVLQMERRAKENGLLAFAEECRQFRLHILMICKTFVAPMRVA